MTFLKIFGSRPRTTTVAERPTVDLHARGRYGDEFDGGMFAYRTLLEFCNIAPMMPSKRPKGFKNEDAAGKILYEAQIAIQQGNLALARSKNNLALGLCPESIAAQDMKNYVDCIFDICERLVAGMRDGKY